MILAQDIQINFEYTASEVIEANRIASEEENSAVVEYGDTPSAIYKHAVKKPKVITPKTAEISPVAKIYSDRLKDGTADERKYLMENINFTINNSPKSGLIYTDKDITDSLFAIINEDISKLKKPSKRKLRLREEVKNNKELSEKQAKYALSMTEREIAEQNKVLAFYTLGTIQNLSYRYILKTTGLSPKLHDSYIIDKVIYEAEQNKDENLRASAIGTLYMILKPEYKDELTKIFQNALSDNSKAVKNMAEEALENIK